MSAIPRYACMQSLLDEIMNIQSTSLKDSDAVRRIGEIIKESNDLIKGSKVPGEVVLDAKILQTGSQIVNSNITAMDTNLTDFNEEEYVTGIRGILEADIEYEVDDDDPDDPSFGFKWKCFAPMMYHLYSKSESPVFVLGSLSFEPPPPKPKPKADRIVKKNQEAKTQLSQASGSEQEKKPEENICEHILRSIVRHMKANRNEPLEFIRFIINPDSYWETIQNIFYFSFLVRDGRVELSHNQRGLPIIGYTFKDPSEIIQTPPNKMNHFSVSMSMREWRACIDRFKITTPMIKPLKKNE